MRCGIKGFPPGERKSVRADTLARPNGYHRLIVAAVPLKRFEAWRINTQKMSDQDWVTVEKVREGDFEAFEQLVDKYEARIYRHLKKMVGDSRQAEDLLQETFLNAYRGMDRFSGASSFSTWLFKIATNNALMYLRRVRPESVEYDDEILSDVDPRMIAPAGHFLSKPDEVLLSKEGRRKIEAAIEELPVIYRSAIILRDVEGFSLQEVAHILDCSLPAVKSRLHRGRNAVRDKLMMYFTERSQSN